MLAVELGLDASLAWLKSLSTSPLLTSTPDLFDDQDEDVRWGRTLSRSSGKITAIQPPPPPPPR